MPIPIKVSVAAAESVISELDSLKKGAKKQHLRLFSSEKMFSLFSQEFDFQSPDKYFLKVPGLSKWFCVINPMVCQVTCKDNLLPRFWSATVSSCFSILFLLRACRGTQCDTWLEKFNMVAAWLTTMTSDSSTPLPKCGSVRTCSDLLLTSTRATASRSAPVLTSIWHTFRWGWQLVVLYTLVSDFYSRLRGICMTGHVAAKISALVSESCCREDFMCVGTFMPYLSPHLSCDVAQLFSYAVSLRWHHKQWNEHHWQQEVSARCWQTSFFSHPQTGCHVWF